MAAKIGASFLGSIRLHRRVRIETFYLMGLSLPEAVASAFIGG